MQPAEGPKSLLGTLGLAPSFVKIYIENSVHYQLRTSLGAAEFAELIPPSGYLAHVKAKDSEMEYSHTIAMFHQLRCLDIIREDYASESGIPAPLREHCINYLRQSVLCLADVRLESVRSLLAPRSILFT